MRGTELSTLRRWLIIGLVLIPVFIGALDLTIVSAILPEVLVRLNIPVDTAHLQLVSWAVTGYLLAYTVSMMVMSRISDMVGRRRVYFICLAIFIAGSWWVATANDGPTALFNQIARQYFHQRIDLSQLTLGAVILGRVIQALGAGAMVPVSLALVGDLFPPARRAQPIGLIGAIDTMGWVLGHLYGGLMVDLFNKHGNDIVTALRSIGVNTAPPDWHTLFYLNVPIGLIAMALTWWALRGVAHPVARGRFDLGGATLIAVALIALNIGLGGGNSDVTASTSLQSLNESALPLNPPLLVGGALCFAIFLIWEWRRPDPLIDLHLFRKRNVAGASLTNLAIGFCLMLGLVSVPLLTNLRVEHVSMGEIATAAARSGILLSGLTIPMALAAVPGGELANRIGYRLTVMIGLGLAVIGFVLAGLTWSATSSEILMGAEIVVVGIGLGLTISPIGTAVINDADESQRGVASALVIILRLVGMTLAISSLLTFALARVNYLFDIAKSTFAPNLTADQLQYQSELAYQSVAIHVIGEMLLIGAAVCVLALIPAAFLRGGALEKPEQAVKPSYDQEPRPTPGR
ncbi:MAG TPA: MFS transporter [Aggregatilineales bacterium]|nr:MFS transporter [Aggregatilineales bacterium]